MPQKKIPRKPDGEQDIAQQCKMWIAAFLYSANHHIVSDQVLLDEGPIEEKEIRELLLDGQIKYPRTDPPIHRLKHVWRAKGHVPPDNDKSVELLLGKFRWVSAYFILAQRVNGEWSWIGG